MQLIKGGFSYRAKKELGLILEIWQPGYYDWRVRDSVEYVAFRDYVRQNPERKRLAGTAQEFCFSLAGPGFQLDKAPQGVKAPLSCGSLNRSAEALRHPKLRHPRHRNLKLRDSQQTLNFGNPPGIEERILSRGLSAGDQVGLVRLRYSNGSTCLTIAFRSREIPRNSPIFRLIDSGSFNAS